MSACKKCVFCESTTKNIFLCSCCGSVHECGTKCDSLYYNESEGLTVCTLTGVVMTLSGISTSFSDNISYAQANESSYGLHSTGYAPYKRRRKSAGKVVSDVNAATHQRVAELMYALFLDSKTRATMQNECTKRVDQEWVRELKRVAKRNSWADLSLAQIYAVREMTKAKSHNVIVVDADDHHAHKEVEKVVTLLTTAWSTYSKTAVMQKLAIDLESFVLGYVTLCKSGKRYRDIEVVPEIGFVKTHMPAATLLSRLSPRSRFKRSSPRPSPFDKKRIIGGQNAILQTINTAAQQRMLSSLVIEYVPTPKQRRDIIVRQKRVCA